DTGNVTDRILDELVKEKENNLARIAAIDAEVAALDPLAEDYAEKAADLQVEKQGLQIRNTVIDETIRSYEQDASENMQQSKEEMMKALDDQFGGSVESTFIQLKTLYDGREKLRNSRIELEAGRQQAAQGQAALDEAQAKLNAGKREYEKGLKDYEEGLMNFNDEIEKAENELKKAREELEALPNASWVLLDRDQHYSSYMFKNTISQMKAIGYALPFLFYLVAALVCMTTMTRLIDEQRSQIGIFMALGFSNAQIISKYVIYALTASLGGSLLGVLAGQAVFPTVIYNTWRLMYALPPIKLYYPLGYVLACILAFSLLMGGVTFLVTRSSLQEMPSQLLRPKAPKSSKRVILERIGFLWKRLPFTSKITARNIFRYKARFLMTVIGVAGCTALLVVGFGIKDSISDIVSIQYGQIFAYDYQINLENDHHLDYDLDILKDDLNNKEVVPFMTYTTKAYLNEKEDDTLYVEVFDARESKQVLNLRRTDHKTEIELDNSGVVISQKFAINHSLKEGDTLTVESLNGIKREVRIAKICEFYFQHYLFISQSYYESVFEENVHVNCIAVTADDKEGLKKDCEALEDFISLVDFSGLIEQFETMIKALDIIIAVIIVAAGSLALVVLINLIQVNIAERIREIATLKVLGFHDQEVNSYIFKEVFLLTIIGGLAGLPLGVVEHHFIMNVINMDMMMFGMNISVFSFSVSLAITLLFTLLVMLVMKKHLQEIEMVESLKSVE
ncbi:MAG: FtsX-like permease family protein, partial [Erysipelotrichaceae bacterium]|nr:FtsX-like permease family protein [Erysipelotrichaceae bacterium]